MNKVILMGRLTRDPNVRHTQQNGSQESMVDRVLRVTDGVLTDLGGNANEKLS